MSETVTASMNCRKCHDSLKRVMLLALMETSGAKVYPSANTCRDGGAHDWRPRQEPAPRKRGVDDQLPESGEWYVGARG